MVLTSEEQKQAATAVRLLIEASGMSAILLRAIPGERLYGSDTAAYAEVGEFPVEWFPDPPTDLGKAIDAVAHVLPELEVLPEDQIRYGGSHYRVQTAQYERLFSVITHQILKLVRLHGNR